MTANEIERQKYLALMVQVAELEDHVAALEDRMAPVEEVRAMQETLAAARTELTRISNGCGHN
jgi:outer membrane murein-binding lipoprotein Lpp